MPTVTYKCPVSGKMKKKVFPYNAVGKAQADSHSKMSGGKLKNNPYYGMEKSTESSSLFGGKSPSEKTAIKQEKERKRQQRLQKKDANRERKQAAKMDRLQHRKDATALRLEVAHNKQLIRGQRRKNQPILISRLM
jgi:hypothetical protein